MAAAAAATTAADADGDDAGLSDDEVADAMADICCDQLLLPTPDTRWPADGDEPPAPSELKPISGSMMMLPTSARAADAAAVAAAVAEAAEAVAAAAAADTDTDGPPVASDDVEVMGDDDVMAGDVDAMSVVEVRPPLLIRCVETACCMPTEDMPNVLSMWAGDQMEAGLALKEPPPPEKLCT